MRDETTVMRDALMAIRAELDRRLIPHKVSAAKAGVGVSTWLSWFPAEGTPQVPSLSFLPALASGLPGDLLSLLVPDGFHIVPDPTGMDYDDFAAGCIRFAGEHANARHPLSECGVDIGPGEEGKLNAAILHLPIKGVVNG
jgi:hypothetical protein